MKVSRIHEEHDACGLWAWVARSADAPPNILTTAFQALDHMSHRAGHVEGEGDGAGLSVDLPRSLWAKRLDEHGLSPDLARDAHFGVGHLLLPEGITPSLLLPRLEGLGLAILMTRRGDVRSAALGPLARGEHLVFWQVAFKGRISFPVIQELWRWEGEGVVVLSWSQHTAVYKCRGDGRALEGAFDDWRDPLMRPRAVLGHVRYSTNTTTQVARAQPFRLLGHNGEINTINRLRLTAAELGLTLPPGGSDSQDLDRLMEALLWRDGLTLAEALTFVFPPVAPIAETLPGDSRDQWRLIRAALGPVAQGPAAIIAWHDTALVASQDALGLRPLWFLESADGFGLTSEQGAVPLQLVRPATPLGPGEKLALDWSRGEPTVVRSPDFETIHAAALAKRLGPTDPPVGVRRLAWSAPPPAQRGPGAHAMELWDQEVLQAFAQGQDPIGSLGFDGPLPGLDEEPGLAADYLQETVAVVTNPAIDRERETAHFSTEVFLGARPWFDRPATRTPVMIPTPLLLDAHVEGLSSHDLAPLRGLAVRATRIAAWHAPTESAEAALARVAVAARQAVTRGTDLLVLDDQADDPDTGWPIDPALVLGTVHHALLDAWGHGQSLRRQVSLVVRSALVRRLHDVAVLLGCGADAVLPYHLWQEVLTQGGVEALGHTARTLREGVEKVMSTMGTYELRGYYGAFSAIGLAPEVADLLDVPLLVPGQGDLHRITAAQDARWQHDAPMRRPYHLYPKLFKLAQQAAASGNVEGYAERLRVLEAERPIALRHLLECTPRDGALAVKPDQVSLSVGEHHLPFVIGSMSFGSQGETAYRAYLKAAALAGMLAMNGEGGEIQDLVREWRGHRGIQVASGRFGITADVVATARYLEIKIGQGAKPGEGGHLPARKVSAQVAAARKSQPGVDLISPSNNHDLYSIEDLAELIHELKTVAPDARVVVKVPVVPNIGTIAVGIVKAGADIVNLSGYEGGTGAARRHAQRHVGLPSDVGTVLVHRALLAAGLRDRAEIWADGGMRGPDDVMKLVLLGANRVGFGTLTMVAAGCTICRACQTDTCHVGIATQIRTVEDAERHGLKRFVPREQDVAAASIAHLFQAMGDGVRARAAQLGAHRLQDLVGMAGLLEQTRGTDRVELGDWLVNLPVPRRITPAQNPEPVRGENRRTWQVAAAGHRTRQEVTGSLALEDPVVLDIPGIAGQGLAAFHADPMVTRVAHGAQDGVAKGMSGGLVVVGGPVGKSLAYGATGGRLFVAGDADTRACIRLSGGEVVLGGWPTQRVDGTLRDANLKGYAFEYMTGGLVVVLGDPGPWMAAGMTGGVVVCLLHPELGLTREYLHRRIAPSAKVQVAALSAPRWADVQALLHEYVVQLQDLGRPEEGLRVVEALADPTRWVAVLPRHQQADPAISTE